MRPRAASRRRASRSGNRAVQTACSMACPSRSSRRPARGDRAAPTDVAAEDRYRGGLCSMNGTELRKAMHGGERVVGTMTSFIRNPRWAAIYGRLGLDYVIVDTEHSPTNRSEAADLAFAFASVG